MNVLVIGGTGFIGYHAVHALLLRGHRVSVLCRHPDRARALFPRAVTLLAGDIETDDTRALRRHLDRDRYHALVFLAGVDERCKPQGPPLDFFRRKNVAPARRLTELARKAGVRRLVLAGSILTHLHEHYPTLRLAERHPYIQSRVEQETAVLDAAGDASVFLLRIPYVFGGTPGLVPLWKSLVHYLQHVNPPVVTRGGANMLSVHTLAEAIAGAVDSRKRRSRAVPVGDENLTWEALVQRLRRVMGLRDRRVRVISDQAFSDLTNLGYFFKNVLAIESGLNTRYVAELVSLEAFFDTAPSQALLGYRGGDLDAAFATTVALTPEEPALLRLFQGFHWM